MLRRIMENAYDSWYMPHKAHVVRLARMGTMAGMGGCWRNVDADPSPLTLFDPGVTRDGRPETSSCLARCQWGPGAAVDIASDTGDRSWHNHGQHIRQS